MDLTSLLFYAFLLYLVKNLYWWYKFRNNTKMDKIKAFAAKYERDSKKYDFPNQNQEVLKYGNSIENLLKGQFEGKFSSVDIVSTYCARCYTTGRGLNLVIDEMYDEALKKARECDLKLQE